MPSVIFIRLKHHVNQRGQLLPDRERLPEYGHEQVSLAFNADLDLQRCLLCAKKRQRHYQTRLI